MNFVAPAFLYGLAAIGIPIIVHLVQLRRAKKVFFTNVAFIREVKNITASHRRLKELLILLCRIGVVTFLVLAFAQPFLPKRSVSLGANRESKIFLDNSFSMQNEPNQAGSSLLETAVAHCRKVIKAVGNNGRFGYFDHSGFSSIYNDYTSTKLNTKLEEVTFSAQQKPFAAVLAGFSSNGNSGYNALIYSDFQKNNFRQQDFQHLDKDQQYFFVHLKGNAEHNIYIDSLELEDEFVRVNQDNRLRVWIRNGGDNNFPNCNIKFFVDDQQVSALNLSVPARQSVPFQLRYRLPDNQPKNCRIVVEDFPVEFDNTYYFTLQASPPVDILDLVDQQDSPTQRLYTNEPLFHYTRVAPGQFNYRLLGNANLVVLNSLSQLSAGMAENLRKFVMQGGTVAFVPAEPEALAKQADFLDRLGLPQVRMKAAAKDNPVQYELAQPDTRDPFFRNIFEQEQKQVGMPRAASLLSWSRSSGDLIRFRNGDKFLSYFRQGKGNIFLFAAPFKEKYSGFASHAIFVPVMYKLAMESYQDPKQLAYSLGAANIQLPVSGKSSEVYKLVQDSLEFVPEQQIREGFLHFSPPAEMTQPGFYRLVLGKDNLGTLAFNLNKKESELDFYNAEEIKDLAGGAPNVHVLEASDEIAIKKLFSQDNLGTQLWKYCLILCLIFALSEILLIRFM